MFARVCRVFLVSVLTVSAAVDWRSITAEAAGMDGSKLAAMRKELEDHQTRALLIARNGRIILEWYREGDGPDTKFGTASLAKLLAGGMSLAGATQDKRISADDLAVKYIPRWKDDPRKRAITIRQLAPPTPPASRMLTTICCRTTSCQDGWARSGRGSPIRSASRSIRLR